VAIANGRKSSGLRRRALGAGAAVALVGIYLGIAAVAHLAPWHGRTVAEGSVAPASPSPSHAASAATSPGPASTASSPAQALRNLIPAGIRAHGCPAGKLLLGAVAVRNCSKVSYGPGKTDALVSYYLFADNAGLEAAYASFLHAAGVQQESGGNCGRFRSFRPPCETAIRTANPLMTGRAMEYTHGGFADIVSSDQQDNLLVWVTAKDGRAMVKWWVNPRQWLATG
jgi:hypothetical protein